MCNHHYTTRDKYNLIKSSFDNFINNINNTCHNCNFISLDGSDYFLLCPLCNVCLCCDCQDIISFSSIKALYNTCKCEKQITHTNDDFSFSYCDDCVNYKMYLIVAMSPNNVIGNNGKIPWNIKNDMDFFKKQTIDSVVIMGFNTFKSIGRPLPNRVNIVITKNKQDLPGIIFTGIKDLFKILGQYKGKKIFVIGGVKIYEHFINYCNILFITITKNNYDGDTYFPFSISQINEKYEIFHKTIYDDCSISFYLSIS